MSVNIFTLYTLAYHYLVAPGPSSGRAFYIMPDQWYSHQSRPCNFTMSCQLVGSRWTRTWVGETIHVQVYKHRWRHDGPP